MQTRQNAHAADSFTSVGWEGCLNAATNEREVIRLCRDFLARLTPDDVRHLPGDCIPGKLFDADDVSSYALTLSRAQFGGGATVHRMATFFSNAGLRMAQIRGRGGEGQ